jgi:hypothetical protein
MEVDQHLRFFPFGVDLLDNDNIPDLDALLTSEGDKIFLWTMSPRGADWLNANYRPCCGSPGNCGCGSEGEKQQWEQGSKRGTWLSEEHALALLDASAAAGLNVDFLHVSRRVRRGPVGPEI